MRLKVAAEALGEAPLDHAADAGNKAEQPDELVQQPREDDVHSKPEEDLEQNRPDWHVRVRTKTPDEKRNRDQRVNRLRSQPRP